jgi:hypothetical protein
MLFDVEPTRNLYNSTIDRIVTGSMLAGTRGAVGSKVSGSLEYRGDQNYSSYVYNKYKKTSLGANRHISFACQNKVIWDSVVPSPLEIYQRNGGKVVSAEYDTLVWNNIFGPPPIPDKLALREFLVKIFISKGTNSYLTASNASSITDNYWYSSFPFQYNYKTVTRVFQSSTIIYSTNGYKEIINGSDKLVYQKGSGSPTSGSNVFGISFVTGNNLSGSSFIQEVVYDYLITPSVFTTLELGYAADMQSIVNLSTRNFYECFFGIRPTIINTDLSYVNTSSMPQCQYSQSFVAQKQGWKFGLYNAFPTNLNVLFNRNRYGQLRDLLEPRKTTKTYEIETGTFSFPIQITFVSGTEAYITSSSPETFDLRETGIYTFEYQCGKPYVDS